METRRLIGNQETLDEITGVSDASSDPTTPEHWEDMARRWTMLALAGVDEELATKHAQLCFEKADKLRRTQTPKSE